METCPEPLDNETSSAEAPATPGSPVTLSNPQTSRLRVLLVEDDRDLMEVMPLLIDDESDLHCVATTDSLEDVAALIEQHAVQVAVLDLSVRGKSALQALPDLCTRFRSTLFLIHSGHSSPEMVRTARESGAAGYVLKSGHPGELTAAIRQVAGTGAGNLLGQ